MIEFITNAPPAVWAFITIGGLALVSALVTPFLNGVDSDLTILRQDSEHARAQDRLRK